MTKKEAFERIAASLDTPMMIVTARNDDEMDGCLVGFSTQCSIHPLRYLVCLSKQNRTYDLALQSATLVVHVLHDAEHDRDLARLFGEETGYEVDKLRQCDWEPGPDGIPVLPTCDWFSGTIIERIDLGDHVGFVLAVGVGRAPRGNESSLGFAAVSDLSAGNPA
jgi:flavin reductase (DIM6/NTAB) family NADH-FMN oxidoreductase RutF